MPEIHRTARSVRTRRVIGFAGLIEGDPRNVKGDFVNLDGSVAQITSVTISGAGGSGAETFQLDLSGHEYLDDYSFEFTTSAAATSNDLSADEIIEAWNQDAQATQFAWATKGASAVIVLTAPRQGAEFAFTAADGGGALTGTPAATQAAADPAEISFGRAVLRKDLTGSNNLTGVDYIDRIGQRIGAPCSTANFTADVWTVAITGTTASETFDLVMVAEDGTIERFTVTTSTTPTLTGDALVTALDESTLAAAVNAAGTVTLTASGVSLKDVYVQENETPATGSYTVAQATEGTRLDEEIIGIVGYMPTMHDTRTIGSAATGVQPGEEATVLEEGKILVAWTGAQPSRGDKVYVGFGSGEEGKLFNAAGANRYPWSRARFEGVGRDNLTYVRLLAS